MAAECKSNYAGAVVVGQFDVFDVEAASRRHLAR